MSHYFTIMILIVEMGGRHRGVSRYDLATQRYGNRRRRGVEKRPTPETARYIYRFIFTDHL